MARKSCACSASSTRRARPSSWSPTRRRMPSSRARWSTCSTAASSRNGGGPPEEMVETLSRTNAMWRNYWTVAVRALAKSKTYSIINIAGLAIGMAACIMILLYIRYEQSYDKWLPDVANTYQLQAWYPHPENGPPLYLQMASYITKDRIKKDFPQVLTGAYLQDNEPVLIKDGQAISTSKQGYMFTDDDFLKVVSLPLISGTTLTAPQTA